MLFNAPREKYLENSGSAILNRFIAFHLEKSNAFTFQDGEMVTEPEIPRPVEARYSICFQPWKDRELKEIADVEEILKGVEPVDRIVVRHGTKPVLYGRQGLALLVKACKQLHCDWEKLRKDGKADLTRVPLFDPPDYKVDYAPNPPNEPEGPFASVNGLRYLVLESSRQRQPSTLPELVTEAVTSEAYNRNMPQVSESKLQASPDVEVIQVNKGLASQRAYNATVRALCRAQIAVVDVTDYEPGVMLLLGIRSVARRGVTIVTTNNTTSASAWSKLPFNLKEMYPVSTSDATTLGELISNAWTQYRLSAHYQDLPAWQASRQTGQGDAAVGPETGILWLCSFSEEYTKEGFAQYLLNAINSQFHQKSKLERITDLVSPQLLAQRLYNAIRFRKLCVVDWTFWSPNVFFELGVRLSTNRFGPVCLLAERGDEEEVLPDIVDQRDHLKKLFAPIGYRLKNKNKDKKSESPFPEIKSRYGQMKDAESVLRRPLVPPAFGSFPYNHTYHRVSEFIDLNDEPGGPEPHEFLTVLMDSLVGPARSAQASPVLFVDNAALAKQIRNSATAIGMAAWFYMNYKLLPEGDLEHFLAGLNVEQLSNSLSNHATKLDGEKFERDQYQQLGERLWTLLSLSSERKDSKLLADIVDSVQSRLNTSVPSHQGSLLAKEMAPLKDRVKRHRNDMLTALAEGDKAKAEEEFQKASREIEEAFKRLSTYEDPKLLLSERAGAGERAVAEQGADFFGIKGGLYRSRATSPSEGLDTDDLKLAIKAYDDGARYERAPRLGILNSYNTVNRLVVRILQDPALLASGEPPSGLEKPMASLLEDAASLIEMQIDEGGRSDLAWAIADIAMIELLRGGAELDWILGRLDRETLNDKYPFQSMLNVIRDLLRTKIEPRERFLAMGHRLRDKLPEAMKGPELV